MPRVTFGPYCAGMNRCPTCWLSAVLLCGLVACGPSVEDQVAELASGRADDNTRQVLLLAKDRAVAPLLRALEAQPGVAGRLDIVTVLSSLMLRTESAPIEAALARLLRQDPDATVRALVARQFGLQRREGSVPVLAEALDDVEGDVRHAALISLGQLESRWPEDRSAIEARIRDLADDTHEATRIEALILRSAQVHEQLQGARQAALTGDVARAEVLLLARLAESPGDKRAAYDLGMHYINNDEIGKGQDVLRTHGMLLDAPVLSKAPRIDGHVEPAEWAHAAYTDSFWQLSSTHEAALPTDLHTELWIGWHRDGIWVAIVCWDEDPDSLVILADTDDDNTGGVWQEDRVGFFWDADRDPGVYVQHAINPAGVHTDALYQQGNSKGDPAWDVDAEWAASIDADRWSVELYMRFDDQNPRPQPGDMWATNFFRSYRGSEFVQWTRTSQHTMRPDQLGMLVFQP